MGARQPAEQTLDGSGQHTGLLVCCGHLAGADPCSGVISSTPGSVDPSMVHIWVKVILCRRTASTLWTTPQQSPWSLQLDARASLLTW